MGSRRHLLTGAGLGIAAAGALPILTASRPARAAGAVTDAEILNFALNLEYLEAEFYSRAVTGVGLTSADTTGTGNQGAVTGGTQVPFKTAAIQQYAAEIAADELAHVRFLRAALGTSAVAEPAIDLVSSFTNAALTAGLIQPGATFNPFADETSFLLAAYLFEDVGVTAYHGAAPLIQNKTYLDAAAGILAVEAYHAATVRTLLYQMGQGWATDTISVTRAALSGAPDDQGVLVNGMANITPTDANGLAFDRTPQQVLNIVYLGGAAANYGFFPQGVNGAIA